VSSAFLGIHHAAVLVSDTARALAFYRDVLGLPEVSRADLPYPGAWLGAGAQQIHLMELPNPDPAAGRPEHGGRDRHVALSVCGLEEIRARLERAGVAYTQSRSGRAALFVRDPDGNALELMEAPKEK
jgi:glyoxylase I family protein